MGEVKDALKNYAACQAVIFVIAFVSTESVFTKDAFVAVGMLNLIFGILVLLIGLFFIISGKQESGKLFLIVSGILFLTGFLTCSALPIMPD